MFRALGKLFPAKRPSASTTITAGGSGPWGESGYQAAQQYSRFHKVVNSEVGSEDKELTWHQRKRLLSNTYQLARLYPFTESASSKLVRYVVGSGVWPRPKTSSERWNRKAAEKFKAHFDDPRLCDVRNRQTLPDILKHLVSHVWLFAGDGALHMLPGLRINPLESDRIGPPAGKEPPKDEVMGVRLTPWGEFTDFRIGERASNGVTKHALVPADQVIFAARTLNHRFDQVRGVPVLAQAFARLIVAGEITTAELAAMNAAAKIAWYQPIDVDINLGTNADGSTKYPDFKVQDGSVVFGPEGGKPQMFSTNRPNDQFQPFLRSVWQEVAACIGVSYELLTGDYQQTNFSTIRGIRMEDAGGFSEIQQWLKRTVLDRLFYWSTSYWIKKGELDPAPKDFEGDASNYLVSWSFPRIEHIDPYKEHQGNRLGLENGGTFHDIHGDDFEEKMRLKSQEIKRIREIAEKDGNELGDLIKPITETAKEPTLEPGDQSSEHQDAMLAFETLKAKFDAYGVGVRAGAITPQEDDEDTFRALAELPTINQKAKKSWEKDQGYRRPITLAPSPGDAPAAPPGASGGSDGGGDDADADSGDSSP